MSVGNKIRIYDLAKEIKQDTKVVIEEARRQGVDVNVPSNSISKEVADKIRSRFFAPKKEAQPARGVKLIKVSKETAPAKPVEAVEAPSDSTPEVTEAPAAATLIEPKTSEAKAAPRIIKPSTNIRLMTAKPVAAVEAAPPSVPAAEENPVEEPNKKSVENPIEKPSEERPNVTRLRPIKLTPTAAEAPPVEEVQAPPAEVFAETQSNEETAQPKSVLPSVVSVNARPTGSPNRPTQNIVQLKITAAGLKAGFKQGEKVVIEAPKPAVQTPPARTADRRPGREARPATGNRFEERNLRPTQGESATPQTVYIPPSGNRRQQGRNVGKGKGKDKQKGARFDNERDFSVPRPLSIDARLQQQLGVTEKSEVKNVRLVEGATVRDFAEKLNVAPRDIVQLLMKRGILATLNQPLNLEVAKDIGKTLGVDVSFVPFEEMVIEQEFEEIIASDGDDLETERAPVITVMGHVDHGKTSLLDAIRSANVAEGEAGGITQHIGAYSVFVPSADDPDILRRVVFLDTPGHEAFTMMRARGAKATDIVVLVVAADDGVMPQTIEAIEHARAAQVPIIVAINKIDKPDANADKVKQELTNYQLTPVEWGGETEMVPVSAKKRENLDTLLETILLTADIKELKASATRLASGVVLESKLDKGRGAVATVLVQQGTLNIGDPFIAGQYFGRVRAMFSDRGLNLTEALPSTPVEVLGLQGVPQAGDTFQVVADYERAQQISNQRQMQARQAALVQTSRRGIESLGQAEVKELLVILKTDVQGSVEVLRATLEKLSTEKIKVRVIRSGVGAITESDVLLASATQADDASTAVVIIGFNVRPESRAAEVAKLEEVDIRLHSIIYKVEEEIRAAMIGMLDAIEKEVILGKALVQEVFKISRVGTIAGCRVTDGVIRRSAKARLIRDGVVIWEGDIDSLKRFKEDAGEVRQGFECGIGLVNYNDLKVNDEIEAFTIERIAPTALE